MHEQVLGVLGRAVSSVGFPVCRFGGVKPTTVADQKTDSSCRNLPTFLCLLVSDWGVYGSECVFLLSMKVHQYFVCEHQADLVFLVRAAS